MDNHTQARFNIESISRASDQAFKLERMCGHNLPDGALIYGLKLCVQYNKIVPRDHELARHWAGGSSAHRFMRTNLIEIHNTYLNMDDKIAAFLGSYQVLL
ncbi:hypothetical protein AAG570_008330 [Ranatra chinensis]|uniref:Uncharacterized protein n=1 Tax=Ranatra chinensis TaxID=642074 RepID=A0ABD0Y654_9HEMI